MIFQTIIWGKDEVLCYNDFMNDDEVDIFLCVPVMVFHIIFQNTEWP